MPFNLLKLRDALRPFQLHAHDRLDSTSTEAARLRRAGELFAPAVVIAAEQTAGRGRGSNTWWSGPGSLTATFVLAADESLPAHHVPLLAGLAVRAAAAELAGTDDVQVKWPNDLLHGGRKLAGLLCERVDHVDLVGVGLNVDCDPADVPVPLAERVTSLNWIARGPVDLTTAAGAVGRYLYRALSGRTEQTFAAALREYDRHHALVGRRVTVTFGGGEPAVAGVCEGMDDTGRLLLRDGQAVHRVVAGHVQLA